MINEYVHIPRLLFFNVGVITPGSRMDFLIFIIYIFRVCLVCFLYLLLLKKTKS
jgi:hypothetical protein